MLGACIDCPISLLTMKLGIQRLLKEHFPEITGVNAITDVSLTDLYDREAVMQKTIFRSKG
jgi:Fe-S cluster biogenesis protein NfuA